MTSADPPCRRVAGETAAARHAESRRLSWESQAVLTDWRRGCVLVGDRETMGLLDVCDHLHWVRDWRRYTDAAQGRGYSPVHSKSLTALYFPNALSARAVRHHHIP